jgi:hypothetical protein
MEQSLMKKVSIVFTLTAFLIINGGCILQAPLKREVEGLSVPIDDSSDNNLRNIFILTSKSEISFLGYRRVIIWETKDGAGKGFYLNVGDFSEENKLEEISWSINKEEWDSLKNILTDQETINRINANLFNKDKRQQAGLDGSFYMYSGFYDNGSYHFSVHSASKYVTTSTLEQKIIDNILDIVPITPEYCMPSGCSHVVARKRDCKGKVVMEKKY